MIKDIDTKLRSNSKEVSGLRCKPNEQLPEFLAIFDIMPRDTDHSNRILTGNFMKNHLISYRTKFQTPRVFPCADMERVNRVITNNPSRYVLSKTTLAPGIVEHTVIGKPETERETFSLKLIMKHGKLHTYRGTPAVQYSYDDYSYLHTATAHYKDGLLHDYKQQPALYVNALDTEDTDADKSHILILRCKNGYLHHPEQAAVTLEYDQTVLTYSYKHGLITANEASPGISLMRNGLESTSINVAYKNGAIVSNKAAIQIENIAPTLTNSIEVTMKNGNFHSADGPAVTQQLKTDTDYEVTRTYYWQGNYCLGPKDYVELAGNNIPDEIKTSILLEA